MKSSSTKNKNFILALTFFTFSLVSVYYLIVMISMQSNAYTLANPEIKNYMAFGETIEFQFETSFDSYIAFYMGVNDTFEIGFHNDKKSNTLVVNSGTWAEKEDSNGKPIFHLIPEYISSNGFNRITVTPIRGDGDYYISQVMVVPESEKSKYVSYNQIDFEIKQYHIELDDAAYQVILDNRADAIKLGFLRTDEDSLVSGKVQAEGSNYNAEIRLKGGMIDHLISDQWSMRIELNGDYCIYGLQKFSLQPVNARNGIWEYLIYEMYREQGGVAIRYDFADVYVNSVYLGVFAVEEFMEKRVIENSLNREGPIIKFNETAVMERLAFYNTLTAPCSELTVFSGKKTAESENLSDYTNYAITLLNKFLYESEPVEHVFDVDKYITLNAILDLFSSSHGVENRNARNYYNPVTALLEPIPFDELAFSLNPKFNTDKYAENNGDPTSVTYAYGSSFLPANSAFILPVLLSENSENYDVKIKETLQFLANDYPNFIVRHQDEIDQFTTIIRRDNATFSMNVWNVQGRINDIQSFDTPISPVFTLSYDAELEQNILTIDNQSVLGVKVLQVAQGGGQIPLDQDIVYASRSLSIPIFNLDEAVEVQWTTAFSDPQQSTVTFPQTAFYVVGHAYGKPDDGNALHSPVENYIKNLSENSLLEYGIFTGDISQYTEKDDYIYLKQLVEEKGQEIIAVPGNHDIWQNRTAFLEVFDQYYGVFEKNSCLFIMLDPMGIWDDGSMDVSAEQIEMIAKALEKQERYQNIFVFTHEVIWFEEGNERFGSFSANTIYPNNFKTEILPLFSNVDGQIFFISGASSWDRTGQIYYEQDGKYTYISCGVGGEVRDAVLEFYVDVDGYVTIKLIALNGDDPNALGRIQDYTLGGVY